MIGKSTIGEFFWNLFVNLSTSTRVVNLKKTKHELLATNRERIRTSSMDEFAKWAKLQRKEDKLKVEIQRLESDLSSTKSTILSRIGWIITISTFGPKLYYRYMHRKTVVFWLPTGMFPSYIEWFLALPSSPTGTLSFSLWVFLVDRLIGALFGLYKDFTEPKPIPLESNTTEVKT